MLPEDCQTIDDVRGLLRNVVYSPLGLATIDASQIEARAILWLAGDEEGLDVYRRGEDAYKRFASRIYAVPVDQITKPQRQVGKIGVLGCGYAAGAGAIGVQAEQRGVDLAAAGVTATQVVERWRDAHSLVAGERTGYEFVPEDPETGEPSGPPIQERRGGLWRELRDQFKLAALSTPGKHAAAGGRLSFHWEPAGLDGSAGGDVVCLLPSGREIRYRQVREEMVPDKFRPGELKRAWTYAAPRGGRPATYGGLLAENATQALCRDLLALGMVRLEAAGYRVVLHVHDEVVVELERGRPRAEQFEEIKAIMGECPAWAAGLPFAVAGDHDERWSK